VLKGIEKYRAINPLLKAPTVLLPGGELLVDSQVILQYFDSLVPPGARLTPGEGAELVRCLRLVGVALVAAEKAVQHLYETNLRPKELHFEPWLARVREQLAEAWKVLEVAAAQASPWLLGERLTQADVTVASVWSFHQYAQPGLTPRAAYPALSALAERAEALPEFRKWPVDHESHLGVTPGR
jgi:glutathione S-transferase